MNTIANSAKNGYSRAMDGVTLGYIKSANRIKNFSLPKRGEERGDIVQVFIIIAIFVVIAIVAGNIIYKAVVDAATSAGNCIKNANLVKTGGTTSC